tara:strand:- start:4832 stop:5332 length:501 start_codon:yes stop_codon:yes gene_type:complete
MSSNKKNDLTPNKRYIIYGVDDNEQLTSNAVSLFTEPGNRTPTGPIEIVNTNTKTVTDIIKEAKGQAIQRQKERRNKSSQNIDVKHGDNVKVEITVSSNNPSYSPITTSSSSSKNKRKGSPKGSPKNTKKKGGKSKKTIKKNKKSKKIKKTKKTKKGGRRKYLKSL